MIDDFNKQFESTLRMRIDSDIKEIHNRYLRVFIFFINSGNKYFKIKIGWIWINYKLY